MDKVQQSRMRRVSLAARIELHLTLSIEQEVHELILEELVKHLSLAAEEHTSLRRTYFWGPLVSGEPGWEKLQTHEEGRMISGGEWKFTIELQA